MLAVIEEFLAVAPVIMQLGIDITPLLAKLYDAIEELFSGGAITEDKAAALRVTTSQLEQQWQAIVAKASEPLPGEPSP